MEISMFMGATSGLTIYFIAQLSPSPIIFSCRRVDNSIISIVVCYTTLQIISIILYMYNQFLYYIILVFCRFEVCHADVYMYIDAHMWIVAVSSIHSNSYVSVIEVLEQILVQYLQKTAFKTQGFEFWSDIIIMLVCLRNLLV